MTDKTAILYRMVMPDHICPFGLKAKDLLERQGFEVEDHHLKTREETDAFKEKYDVKTTPQTFIESKRIGGYDDTRRYFGLDVKGKNEKTYVPVIVVFVMAALMALAASWAMQGNLFTIQSIEWFVAFAMAMLAMLKLRDLESFSNMFLNYDILARKVVRYAYIYPFAEAAAAVLMIAGGVYGLIAAPVALFIGTIGAVSVFKAVYMDKRDLKCACTGGGTNVPLGFVSLSENLGMIGMALWMVIKSQI